MELELILNPQDAVRLRRRPELARPRTNGHRTRPTARQIVWHDDPDGTLGKQGLALAETLDQAEAWQVQRIWPGGTTGWAPGTPSPVIASATDPHLLSVPPPLPLIPLAGFAGHARPLGGPADVTAILLDGVMRSAKLEQPVCRLQLAGPDDQVAGLALGLARHVRLAVPRGSLAADAYTVASVPPPPRSLTIPTLAPDLGVAEAFATVVGHLACVLLHWAPGAASGTALEPVHQMRVAMRRLRSAILLFKRAVGCPLLDAATAELRELGRALGPARDWDVFGAGTGQALREAMPNDPEVTRLLAAAERQRQASYQALRTTLDSPGFRRLGIMLSVISAAHPWDWVTTEPVDPAVEEKRAELLSSNLADYAAKVLGKRLESLLEPGPDIAELPAEALHAIRLHGKRLRYAAEFFAPLFPGHGARRFIRRLTVLQERLGHLNDGEVAANLIGQLGTTNGPRSYAAGVVRGFIAAQANGSRTMIDDSWRKFRKLEPFWS